MQLKCIVIISLSDQSMHGRRDKGVHYEKSEILFYPLFPLFQNTSLIIPWHHVTACVVNKCVVVFA